MTRMPTILPLMFLVSPSAWIPPLSAPVVRPNGLFLSEERESPSADVNTTQSSPNGTYQSRFARHDDGTLHSLEFLVGGKPAFSLSETDAHSLEISNSGTLLLIRIDGATETPLRFSFYSSTGRKLLDRPGRFSGYSKFSEGGSFFGICGPSGLEVIHPASGRVKRYRTGRRFDVSDDGTVVAVAYAGGVSVYAGEGRAREIATGFLYNRSVKISAAKDRLAVMDARQLNVYSLPDLRMVFSDTLGTDGSFRQIRFGGADTLWAGVKYEDGDWRTGVLKTFTSGSVPSTATATQAREAVGKSGLDLGRFRQRYGKTGAGSPAIIPWPLAPQDRAHPAWNNYEGLNTSGDGVITAEYPYLHQGLDIEVDANSPVYSVDTGIVKYHGDLGGSGAMYWRLAVSKSRATAYSTGWMYAHLVESSINYDVGDRIGAVGLHLGDVVPWFGDVSGHLHFNEIRDQGATWTFAPPGDEWGITSNPQLVLRPLPDTTKPVIVPAIAGKSKFAYCRNNSGYGTRLADYFFPDSARGGVKGDIDIVVKLYDYMGFTNFTQPAYKLRYWIKAMGGPAANRLIVDTTMAQMRNHAYDFYTAGRYKSSSEVLYKVDSVFVVGGWFNRTRRFSHILTNNDGDTLLATGERDSCLRTARHADGWYRIHVKAYDISGNAASDSEAVYFNNGNKPSQAGGAEAGRRRPAILASHRSAQGLTIRFRVSAETEISLQVLDLAGRVVATPASGRFGPGEHSVVWAGMSGTGPGRKTYCLVLRAGGFSALRKLVL